MKPLCVGPGRDQDNHAPAAPRFLSALLDPPEAMLLSGLEARVGRVDEDREALANGPGHIRRAFNRQKHWPGAY